MVEPIDLSNVASQLSDKMRLLLSSLDQDNTNIRAANGKVAYFQSMCSELSRGVADLRERQQRVVSKEAELRMVEEEQKKEAARLDGRKQVIGHDFENILSKSAEKVVNDVAIHVSEKVGSLETSNSSSLGKVLEKVDEVVGRVGNDVGDLRTDLTKNVDTVVTRIENDVGDLRKDLSTKVNDGIAGVTDRLDSLQTASSTTLNMLPQTVANDVATRLMTDLEALRTSNNDYFTRISVGLGDTFERVATKLNIMHTENTTSLSGISNNVESHLVTIVGNINTLQASNDMLQEELATKLVNDDTTNIADKIESFQTSNSDSIAALIGRFELVDTELSDAKRKGKEVDELKSKLTTYGALNSQLRADRETAHAKATEEVGKAAALESKVSALESKISELESKVSELENDNLVLEASMNQDLSSGAQLDAATNELAIKNTTIADHLAKIEELKPIAEKGEKFEVILKERDETIAKFHSLESVVKRKDDEIAAQYTKANMIDPLQGQIKDLQAIVKKRDEELSAQLVVLRAATEERDGAKAEIAKLTSEKDDNLHSQEISQLKERVKSLEEEVGGLKQQRAPTPSPDGSQREERPNKRPSQGDGDLAHKRQRTLPLNGEASEAVQLEKISEVVEAPDAPDAPDALDAAIECNYMSRERWRRHVDAIAGILLCLRPAVVKDSALTMDGAIQHLVWAARRQARLDHIWDFMDTGTAGRWHCFRTIAMQGWRAGGELTIDKNGWCPDHKESDCIQIMRPNEKDLVVLRKYDGEESDVVSY